MNIDLEVLNLSGCSKEWTSLTPLETSIPAIARRASTLRCELRRDTRQRRFPRMLSCFASSGAASLHVDATESLSKKHQDDKDAHPMGPVGLQDRGELAAAHPTQRLEELPVGCLDGTMSDTTTPATEADNLTSLQSYLLAEESKHPDATGRFTWILSAISLSTKFIADKVRRARLQDVLGTLGSQNVHDEEQQKLDVIADEALIRCLRSRNSVAIVASEENEEPILVDTVDQGKERPYVVLFDPLDGSSNLDTCSGIGTIFSVLEHDRRAKTPKDSVLQPGHRQVAAGYVVYGSSTVLVLTTGTGVQMFVLDPSIGAYMLVDEDVRIPQAHKSYSLNEAYIKSFPEGYQRYLDYAHSNGYSSRYIGSMVADIHRILVKGGVFMYPPTQKAPKGKLRLLYEANPMAMIIEQAGGKSFTGVERTLDIQPEGIHQRVSVLMGSSDEVDKVLEFLG